MKAKLLHVDSCTRTVGKHKFVTLHTSKCRRALADLGIDPECVDENSNAISSPKCLSQIDISAFDASETLEGHASVDESKGQTDGGLVGQYYLNIMTTEDESQCKKACSENEDCSHHKFSKLETCHMFETARLCRAAVEHNACRCRNVDTKSCLNSTDTGCERKLYKTCADATDVPVLDPCRKEQTYMEELPEGREWISTRTCTALDHRNCEQTRSNYVELLRRVTPVAIDGKDVFSKSGNCVLFTNEMAVLQGKVFERRAIGGKTPRRHVQPPPEDCPSAHRLLYILLLATCVNYIILST